ncbi:hypothetical protein Rsub_00406 [Raphidocelis subcapitata]|uniref:non-specific serine/threonine protein kinase n=1 Tax=Raphidocelis subcapitata TaxID=307507 RepID=A0A2V0NS79_9CHLO|nr:hypothetical protein Rsub_00406 [Raphidocelis subcapitata]|eukprot:GBF87695.1 hypothetical protein Rsub_00406 [Raphidocelis subcapitata]
MATPCKDGGGASAADPGAKYEIREQIGKGSFGSAFLVIHRATRRPFVLKRIRLAKQTNWQRASTFQEKDLVSKLQHPYIVPHIESWITQGHTVNIVYGYCEKGDLATLLAKSNGAPLPEPQLRQWLCQMLLALEYLQCQRVLHRDIKTANCFLTAGGDVQLGDFGLATYRGAEGAQTEDANLVGTPHYMSPELLSSRGYGFKSDTWSLGCVFYELTAQRPAFQAFNIHGLVAKIRRHRAAPLPSGYSAEWAGIISLMLRKDPARRPSVQELMAHAALRPDMDAARARALDLRPDLRLPPLLGPWLPAGGGGSDAGGSGGREGGSSRGLCTGEESAGSGAGGAGSRRSSCIDGESPRASTPSDAPTPASDKAGPEAAGPAAARRPSAAAPRPRVLMFDGLTIRPDETPPPRRAAAATAGQAPAPAQHAAGGARRSPPVHAAREHGAARAPPARAMAGQRGAPAAAAEKTPDLGVAAAAARQGAAAGGSPEGTPDLWFGAKTAPAATCAASPLRPEDAPTTAADAAAAAAKEGPRAAAAPPAGQLRRIASERPAWQAPGRTTSVRERGPGGGGGDAPVPQLKRAASARVIGAAESSARSPRLLATPRQPPESEQPQQPAAAQHTQPPRQLQQQREQQQQRQQKHMQTQKQQNHHHQQQPKQQHPPQPQQHLAQQQDARLVSVDASEPQPPRSSSQHGASPEKQQAALLKKALTLAAALFAKGRFVELGALLSSPGLAPTSLLPGLAAATGRAASAAAAASSAPPCEGGAAAAAAASAASLFRLGDAVVVGGQRTRGVIRWCGPVAFDRPDVDYVGLLLDRPRGRHSGCVQGITYFEAGPGMAEFVRASKLAQGGGGGGGAAAVGAGGGGGAVAEAGGAEAGSTEARGAVAGGAEAEGAAVEGGGGAA